MGKESEISWCDSSKNLWWGCQAVSPECDDCYAENWAERCGFSDKPGAKQFKIWGQDERRRMLNQQVDDVMSWNTAAAKAGMPRRVFWNSMSDMFENRREFDAPRALAFEAMERTPFLTHLILTKRPHEMGRLLPPRWVDYNNRIHLPNIWAGVTIGLESSAWRWAELRKWGSAFSKLFISYEPALGPVDFRRFMIPNATFACHKCALVTDLKHPPLECPGCKSKNYWCGSFRMPDLVIAGGESQKRARPPHPDWFRQARDQVTAAGGVFHFKQWGEWAHTSQLTLKQWRGASAYSLVMPAGGKSVIVRKDDPDPEFGMTCRDLDGNDGSAAMAKVGKKLAGHMLDDKEWREMPA